MKIETVRIENFRSFKDETISFNDYTCLVGPNGSGKSTILNALNIFFRESKSSVVNLLTLSEEDFHCKDTSSPIRITVTFVELSDKAKTELKDYVRNDKLIVSAVAEWSAEARLAPVIQRGQRLAMPQFACFFKALGDRKLLPELKVIYSQLKQETPELPSANTKQGMTDVLHQYEQSHPGLCTPIESEDEFYGVTKGAHKLGAFIQWHLCLL